MNQLGSRLLGNETVQQALEKRFSVLQEILEGDGMRNSAIIEKKADPSPLREWMPRNGTASPIYRSRSAPGTASGMAMFEMLVHVNRMMRRFRLTRAGSDAIELEAQINLRPRSNLMMTVEER